LFSSPQSFETLPVPSLFSLTRIAAIVPLCLLSSLPPARSSFRELNGPWRSPLPAQPRRAFFRLLFVLPAEAGALFLEELNAASFKTALLLEASP
jgi:hypothetical protein